MPEPVARSHQLKCFPRFLRRHLREQLCEPSQLNRLVVSPLGEPAIHLIIQLIGEHQHEARHHLPEIVLSARSLANHYRYCGLVETN